ncbi:MAG: hypothetical protein WAU52_14880 [Burkholderiales bacterium]
MADRHSSAALLSLDVTGAIVDQPQRAGEGHPLFLVPYTNKSAEALEQEGLRGCPNASFTVGLRLADGSLIAAPCGSPRCTYCAANNADVVAGALILDARGERPPRYAVTLTTRDALPAAQSRQALASYFRALRLAIGLPVEYFWRREWTSGGADGVRREHFHVALKVELVEAGWVVTRADRSSGQRTRCYCADAGSCVECWTRGAWKRYAGAWVVYGQDLYNVRGAIAYWNDHHAKAEQAMPSDAPKGTRTRGHSRGYFGAGGIGPLLRRSRLDIERERRIRAGRDPDRAYLDDLLPPILEPVSARAFDGVVWDRDFRSTPAAEAEFFDLVAITRSGQSLNEWDHERAEAELRSIKRQAAFAERRQRAELR